MSQENIELYKDLFEGEIPNLVRGEEETFNIPTDYLSFGEVLELSEWLCWEQELSVQAMEGCEDLKCQRHRDLDVEHPIPHILHVGIFE